MYLVTTFGILSVFLKSEVYVYQFFFGKGSLEPAPSCSLQETRINDWKNTGSLYFGASFPREGEIDGRH